MSDPTNPFAPRDGAALDWRAAWYALDQDSRAELARVTAERDRLRSILQDIASSGRCDFATVRAALQQESTLHGVTND
jgi:hypothetical protein